MPVQRIVGRVEINNDLPRGRLVRLQEQRHEQPLNGRRVVPDLVIARHPIPAQLKPIERRFARHRGAVLAQRFKLSRQHRHHRIAPQLVVIVDVFIAERDPKHALADQRRYQMFDQLRSAAIDKARGKPLNQPDRTIRRPQQQCPRVRGDRSAIKPRHNPAAVHSGEFEQFCTRLFYVTVCRHRGVPRIARKSLSHNNFR